MTSSSFRAHRRCGTRSYAPTAGTSSRPEYPAKWAAYLGGQLGTDLESTADFLLSQGEIQGVAAPQAYAGSVYANAAATVSAK
ncbi:hypothetical protein [Nocardia sp. NPDC046763]|uniref:hypothetical protein n=1 Tax=Nocardia sp. NPDC046763 TaxID=3155256 RepID=UPI00340A1E2F